MVPRNPIQDYDRRAAAGPLRGEGLALLYQGILTAIVRIRSGKQPIPSDPTPLQRQMENLLKEIEREGVKNGYRNEDIEDTHYAVVAFVDEAILRSEDPNRGRWTPLGVKLFSDARVGENIYERLRSIRGRRESAELAEVLEIYCLCFSLGYEGKYALGGRAELDRLMEDLRDQIERIRGRQPLLSPEGALPAPSIDAPAAHPLSDKWKLIALACFAFMCLSWIVLRLVLNSYTEGAIRDMFAP